MSRRLRLVLGATPHAARLDAAVVERLLAALEGDVTAAVVTLEGTGDVFCEGLDLEALVRHPDDGPTATETVSRFGTLLRALGTSPRPVVALVGGRAMGGGVGLVAASDLVIASPHATFSLPEAIFGLVPAMILPVLARRIGVPRARWLAMSAGTLTAEEGQRAGLVDEITDDLDGALARHLRRLERLDARAVAASKSLAAGLAAPPDEYHERAVATFAGLAATDDTRARVARWLSGESPWPEREES